MDINLEMRCQNFDQNVIIESCDIGLVALAFICLSEDIQHVVVKLCSKCYSCAIFFIEKVSVKHLF